MQSKLYQSISGDKEILQGQSCKVKCPGEIFVSLSSEVVIYVYIYVKHNLVWTNNFEVIIHFNEINDFPRSA